MNLELLLTIAALLIICYFLFDRDLLSPSVIFNCCFLFSICCCLINTKKWGVNLSIDTYLSIVFSSVFFSLGELCFRLLFYRGLINGPKRKTASLHYVYFPQKLVIFIFALEILVSIFCYNYVIQSVGGGSFSQVMYKWRSIQKDFPFLLRQFVKIASYLNIYFCIIFANNFNISKRKRKTFVYLLPVLGSLLISTVNASRANFLLTSIRLGVLFLFCFVFRKRGKMHVSFKTILFILLFLLLFLFVFSNFRLLVGRMSDSNNLAYITAYAGGSIELLNLDFLHNGSLSYSTIKGGSTFLGFFSDLQQLGFLSFEINDTFPLTSTGLQIGNVYTAIGNVISDYGLFGNYLLMLFQGFVFSLSYENFKKSKSLFSTSSIIYIIIVPAMFYLSISSAFTRDYLCMNTAIEIIFLVLCVKFQRRAKWSKKKSTCFFIKQNAS